MFNIILDFEIQRMRRSASSYRDRIYIVADIILKLLEYSELNQTALATFCGLNLKKHKPILDDLETNELISRREMQSGKRIVTVYKPRQKGIDFYREILEPYEKMFPRRKDIIIDDKGKLVIAEESRQPRQQQREQQKIILITN
jgi:predicted transcriptional regulator